MAAEMCRIQIRWGNYEGPHDHDIGFAKVAPIKAKPMALVVEAANPRHVHEWTVWRDLKLPDDKILVAGVAQYLDKLRRASRTGHPPRPG